MNPPIPQWLTQRAQANEYFEPVSDDQFEPRQGPIILDIGTRFVVHGPVIEIVSGRYDGIRLFLKE